MAGDLTWWVPFVVFNLVIAVQDFRWRRVPNSWLVAALAAQAVWLLAVLHGWASPGAGAAGFAAALAAFGLAMIVFFPLWRLRALGAGDVKYIATLGFLLGPQTLIPVLVAGTLASGLHAAAIVVRYGWTQARAAWRPPSGTGRRGIPYAAYLALAAITWLAWTGALRN